MYDFHGTEDLLLHPACLAEDSWLLIECHLNGNCVVCAEENLRRFFCLASFFSTWNFVFLSIFQWLRRKCDEGWCLKGLDCDIEEKFQWVGEISFLGLHEGLCTSVPSASREQRYIAYTTIEPIASNICVLYIFSASSLCTEGVQKGSVYKLADDVLVIEIFPF